MLVLATCRFGTLEIYFSRVNSLVGDDNAREYLVGLILALGYAYIRVLNMSFNTANGNAIILWCHPTYAYSMIPLRGRGVLKSLLHSILLRKQALFLGC